MVGFMPIKSFPSNETELTFGVSVTTASGIPEIGKFRPLEVFITCAVPK